MSDTVIKVEDLAKAYRIGLKEQKSDTLGAAMMAWIKSPAKNFRRLKNLSAIHAHTEDEDIFWALKDISFEVKRGDILGVIGKNGAGKSTLLKILSKITDPTKGCIEITGRVASLLEVGTGFNPDLTGRENTYLNGTILGMTKKEIDRKFDEIVNFSGIEKFIDTPVKRYSTGMKVRLGFAVAAHLDPEILIVDEVLAVGDYEFQKKCIGKMQDVSRYEGRTVLFVSHNLAAIKQLCNKGLYLKGGCNEAFGDVDDILNLYKTADHEVTEKNYVVDSEKIKLLDISIDSPDGEKILNINKSIIVTTKFECKEADRTMSINLYIYNEEDILLFIAPAIFAKDNNSEKRIYTVKFEIPPFILNTGYYKGSIYFAEALKYKLLWAQNILNFNLEETLTFEERTRNKIPGIIRPNITYTIE
jgi:lipopolysaccharide transport system ATP-binding protein